MTKSQKQSTDKSAWLIIVGLVILGIVMAVLLRGKDVVLLNPKGIIANEQYTLMMHSTYILVGYASVVLFVLYFFAWKYRETNKKHTYDPKVAKGKSVILAIWAAPTLVMVVLASMMIPATFKLQPRAAIESDKQPITVQVVALRWKWLFIYPEHDIATVNYVKIPVDTPVQFILTADEAPMNAFWIPHLGGMLYAMTEHVNQLNLMGDTIGSYQGSAAEINGSGFAGMRFKTDVTTDEDFRSWVRKTKQTSSQLDMAMYESLLTPSENNAVALYSRPDNALFSTILSKYAGSHDHSAVHGGDDHMKAEPMKKVDHGSH